MRRVVCADNINNILFQSLNQSIPVLFCTKRRVHLIICIIFQNIFRSQGKMMWTHFPCYRKFFFLCKLNHADAVLCRTMAQMQSCSCFFCQNNVSGSNDIFYCIADSRKSQFSRFCIFIDTASVYHVLVFAMSKHRNIMSGCNFHGFFIQFHVHNRFSVFTDSRNTGLNHAFNIRQFFSFLLFCHRSKLQYMNRRQGFCLIVYILYPIRTVNHRFCIWHG